MVDAQFQLKLTDALNVANMELIQVYHTNGQLSN